MDHLKVQMHHPGRVSGLCLDFSYFWRTGLSDTVHLLDIIFWACHFFFCPALVQFPQMFLRPRCTPHTEICQILVIAYISTSLWLIQILTDLVLIIDKYYPAALQFLNSFLISSLFYHWFNISPPYKQDELVPLWYLNLWYLLVFTRGNYSKLPSCYINFDFLYATQTLTKLVLGSLNLSYEM